MLGGLASSLALFAALRRGSFGFDQLRHFPQKGLVLLAAFFSSYLAMMLWIAAFKWTKVSVAAVLNQTTTFFTVLLAAWLLRERLTGPKIAATTTAVVGVLLTSDVSLTDLLTWLGLLS